MMRLLQLSLALNLVLAALTWWRADSERVAEGGPADGFAPSENRQFKRVARTPTRASAPPTPWAALDREDPTELIANLRSIGCPEETIRDLVYFKICRGYRERLRQLETAAAWNWDYTRYLGRPDHHRLEADRRVLSNEMLAQVESVLGQPFDELAVEVFGFVGQPAEDEEYLPLSKRRQVREVRESYRALRDVFSHRQFNGALEPVEEAILADSWRQEESQLAAILTPREFEEWFFRESPAAVHVRVHLDAARSETEYREMVRLAHTYDVAHRPRSISMVLGRFGLPGPGEDPAVKEYQQREAAFNRELRQLLDRMNHGSTIHE
jgi:hypothetical protein